MATKLVAREQWGSADSLDERVSESRAEGEVGEGPEAEDTNLQENLTVSTIKMQEQEPTAVSLHSQGGKQETEVKEVPQKTLEALETGEVSEKPLDQLPEEREAAEWIRDTEIISDLTSSDEWPQTPQLDERVDKKVEATCEEVAGERAKTEENTTSPRSVNDTESECDMSGAAATSTSGHSPSDRCNSEDDEGEGEDSDLLIHSFQQEWGPMDDNRKPHTSSESLSVSSVQNPTSPLPVVSLAKQQGELPPQSNYQPAPRGENQEATQQVLGQGSPPLSAVAMELVSKGGAASQGSGCVVNVRERYRRAEERIERETEQTGGEEEQKESGLETNKAGGEEHGVERVKTQGQEPETFCRPTRMESDSNDDSQSDSGVSADFSPNSSMDTQTTITAGSSTRLKNETPIEREIRRTVEREQSLRRSRGLPTPPSIQEYVEIPLKKNILPQSLTAKSERNPSKDRQFAGKKMLQEIHEEAQREQDLVKLGKVPGSYDKGTVRQLKERKLLFEAFQEPKDPSSTISTRSKTQSLASGSERSTFVKQKDISSQASTTRGSYVERGESVDQLRQTQSQDSAKGGRSTCCQVAIQENNLRVPSQKLHHAKPEAEAFDEVDSGTPHASTAVNGAYSGITGTEHEREEEEAPKENPFFKLRSSKSLVRVERDIREAQERERELLKQRITIYGGPGVGKGGGGGGGGGGGRPVSKERKSPTRNEEATPDLPAPSSRGGSGPASARQSLGKLGTWPPAQAEQEQHSRPEVHLSTRTPRQKTPLLQRWESGLVNGHNEDD